VRYYGHYAQDLSREISAKYVKQITSTAAISGDGSSHPEAADQMYFFSSRVALSQDVTVIYVPP